VNQWLLDGLSAAFPRLTGLCSVKKRPRSSSRKANLCRRSGSGSWIPWMAPRISSRAQANTPFIWLWCGSEAGARCGAAAGGR
jgi:hypothetical protein